MRKKLLDKNIVLSVFPILFFSLGIFWLGVGAPFLVYSLCLFWLYSAALEILGLEYLIAGFLPCWPKSSRRSNSIHKKFKCSKIVLFTSLRMTTIAL